MWQFVLDHPDLLEAAATVLLTFFAGVQISLEVARRRDRAHSAAIEAHGPAWLARRRLESSLRSATTAFTPRDWARGAASTEALNILQQRLLEVLRLGALAGRTRARAAEAAFKAFLAFTDRANQLRAINIPYDPLTDTAVPSPADLAEEHRLASDAYSYLEQAITSLEVLAPRQPQEPAMPLRQSIRLLAPPTPPAGNAA